MMAALNPKSHGVAFEDPQVIRADVYENGVLSSGQNVSIFSNTMMKWRGECFLTTGNFSNSDIWFQTCLSKLSNERLGFFNHSEASIYCNKFYENTQEWLISKTWWTVVIFIIIKTSCMSYHQNNLLIYVLQIFLNCFEFRKWTLVNLI